MRIATVTLSLPWGGRSSTIQVLADGKAALAREVARSVKRFAARRGVAAGVVDYDVSDVRWA